MTTLKFHKERRYLEVVLACSGCGKLFAFTTRTFEPEKVYDKGAWFFTCPRCDTSGMHYTEGIHELNIGHLEEYIKFV